MVIVGATKTGKSIHNFLKLRDIPHSIVDTRDNASFIEDDSEEFLSIVKFGKEKVREAIANAEEVYFSPSIDQTEFEIPKEKIKSELNLFLTFSKHFTIGITGTNGKSTVCYFISQLLDSLEVPNEIIGNFGLPMINGLSEDLNKVLIVELSSFQLEDASNSSLPNLSGLNIAGFINFSDDHLDRHASEETYLNAKKCIEKKIKPNGVFLYNQAYIATHPSYSQKGIPVGKENLGYNYRQLAECLAFEFNDQEIARTTQKLSAINAENLLFAIGVVHQLFIQKNVLLPQPFNLDNLDLLRFRMEVIKDTDKVTIINDSKSTNPHSTCAAINQLAPLNKRLILILGGDTKGLIFSKNLLNLPPDATCYIYGKDKDKIYQEISFKNSFIFETLKEVIDHLDTQSNNNVLILFSPGCSSKDQYRDYIHRGDEFTQYLKDCSFL